MLIQIGMALAACNIYGEGETRVNVEELTAIRVLFTAWLQGLAILVRKQVELKTIVHANSNSDGFPLLVISTGA